MDWPGFAQSIAESVTSALIWAGGAWLLLFLRNKYIEHKLRAAFSRIGVHVGNNIFGVTIKNESEFPVTIRDVAILDKNKRSGFQLQFIESTTSYLFTEKPTKKPMQIELHSVAAPKEPVKSPQGFVELPPQTGSIWALPKQVFRDKADILPYISRAVIEYRTLLGNTKLFIVESEAQSAMLLTDSFEKHVRHNQ